MIRVRTLDLRVRYAETDRMGVVYHANYLAWCEVGRTEYIREAGMSYRSMEERGIGLAVSDVQMRFHAPATYDDVVRVETRTIAFGDVRLRDPERGHRRASGQRQHAARVDRPRRSHRGDAG